MAPPILTLVQAYRGFAALLVVLFHSMLAANAYFGHDPLLDVFVFGSSGVQFFFTLSGFIIYYIHHGDIGSRLRLPAYVRKRVVRIYPIYIFVTLLFLPFWILVPSLGEAHHKDVGELFLSLLLVPRPHAPHLGVAWTLVHEMLFYVVFSVLIISRRLGVGLLVSWVAAIILSNVIGGEADLPLRYLLSVNNLLFVLGMLCAKLALAGRGRWVALFAAGNILFLLTGLLANEVGRQPSALEYSLLVAGFGIASFLVLLQAMSPVLQNLFARWRFPLLLGDASYSIYLIHYPIVSAVCKALVLAGLPVGATVAAFVIAVLASIGAGVSLHLLVEGPMLRALGGRSRRSAISSRAGSRAS